MAIYPISFGTVLGLPKSGLPQAGCHSMGLGSGRWGKSWGLGHVTHLQVLTLCCHCLNILWPRYPAFSLALGLDNSVADSGGGHLCLTNLWIPDSTEHSANSPCTTLCVKPFNRDRSELPGVARGAWPGRGKEGWKCYIGKDLAYLPMAKKKKIPLLNEISTRKSLFSTKGKRSNIPPIPLPEENPRN